MNVELVPFSVPNYVIVKMPPRSRQEGLDSNAPKFELKDLDAEELSKMCNDFRKAIFCKAGKKDPLFV